MKITIAGKAGSGKSTVAKILAKKLKYKHYSMGDFQRNIAEEKGVDIVQLGEIEKEDDSIDNMVDDKQRKLGEEQDNFIIDSWLGAHFIPDSFRIFLDVDIDKSVERIAKRNNEKSVEDVKEKIQQREMTNKARWIKYYDYDFSNEENYDLVLDTTNLDIDEVVDVIYEEVKKRLKIED